MEEIINKIKVTLNNYDENGLKLFKDSCNELFKNGFSRGCYQDYGVVADISKILTLCEEYIAKNNG